jgi:energy-coupling factor transport system ATP-binding protein
LKLTVAGIGLAYGNTLIFKNLSFALNEGEILAIRGSNGSGKSSLCLCLAGLLDADGENVKFRGDIFYDDKNLNDMTLAQKCGAVGIVFQNPDTQLFSPLVIEELAFAPENLALPREEIKSRVDDALKKCGIEHLKNCKTNSLSGGEKQLAAIASVLTMRPKILIADEITSRVDADKKHAVRKILTDFAASGGSVITVAHSEKDIAIASRVIDLERGKDYANYAF